MQEFNVEFEIEKVLVKIDTIERLLAEIHEELQLIRLKSTQCTFETQFGNIYEK